MSDDRELRSAAEDGPRGFDPEHEADFDRFADDYTAVHARNVALSGESPEYFARYKCAVLRRLVASRSRVLDYGCGVGNLTKLLSARFAAVTGYDPSPRSIARAREQAPRARFTADAGELRSQGFDALVLANVLHHVPPPERPALLRHAAGLLAPGGRLVVFEHNPWNPVTRRVVRDCPFDEDAVLLRPGETLQLLRRTGLARVRREFIVFFPRPLAALRRLEPWLGRVPLGAQYVAHGLVPRHPR